ncbi:flavin reductase family protein [Pseudorhodobacter sp. W20_MBD10_FR17]|uniref:flavin reductase family protein n=1 Tax=Pseudorhodobacter sp. W20_MBD10_FR17 TaxID=3240266 RepID=UPI003F98AF28
MTIENTRLLRDAFGAFMTGVTVVTTMDETGQPIGFTANSFSSVSLDPPLLLVSIAKSSSNHGVFAGAKGFAINILSETQKDVSNTFARPVEDRFATVKWAKGPGGAPVIEGVSTWFDCALHQVVEAGDHDILIGRVVGFDANHRPGLGYYRGSYFSPSAAAEAVAAGPDVVISAIIEAGGSILLVDDGQGGISLPMTRVGRAGAQAALAKMIADLGISAAPGFIYAFYEDTKSGQQNIAFLCAAAEGVPIKGAYVPMSSQGVSDVGDPAVRSMLERFVQESAQGNYGVYIGNQDQGRVSSMEKGQPS